MLKKILIGVVILAVLAGVGFVLVVLSATDRMKEAFEEKEPEFRQYVTMSVEDQNAYVEKNMKEVLTGFGVKFDSENSREMLARIDTDPEVKTATVELGRSIIAAYILDTESMADVINDGNRAWLQADKDASQARTTRYTELVEKYQAEKKANAEK